jgi:uncharacterized membrane protein YhaH (DUF805 family)
VTETLDAIQPYAPPAAEVRDPEAPATHSRLDLLLFWLALVGGALVVASIGIGLFIEFTVGNHAGSASMRAIVFSIIGGMGLLLLGVVLGIVAVFRRKRDRAFASKGLLCNAVPFVLVIAFLLLR